MHSIARILVPIHECCETYREYDHALSIAREFDATVVVAAVVRESSFVRVGFNDPGAMTATIDANSLER